MTSSRIRFLRDLAERDLPFGRFQLAIDGRIHSSRKRTSELIASFAGIPQGQERVAPRRT